MSERTTMAYRAEVLVIDHEQTGEQSVKGALEQSRYYSPQVMQIEGRDIGVWHDDHPLNKHSSADAEYRRLFATTSQDSTQAGGFVAGVMRRVENYADWHACHAAEFGYQGNEGVPNFKGTPEIASERAALVAHLTTHASQQAAVVAGLVGAAEAVIREALDDVDVHPCDHNNDDARARGLYGTKRALYDALHAMKEQP